MPQVSPLPEISSLLDYLLPTDSANEANIKVERGEIIDFVVDSDGDYEADDFQWSPVIAMEDRNWDARKDFAGPRQRKLTPREQLAQVLLLTNEFAFLD